MSLGLGLVRGTLFAHKVSILGEVAMEEGPSTITPLIHIVALHEVLWRKYWNLLSVLKLKS